MSRKRDPQNLAVFENDRSRGDKGLEFQAKNVTFSVSNQVMLALVAILSAIIAALV